MEIGSDLFICRSTDAKHPPWFGYHATYSTIYIPISGMVIGNAMVLGVLFLNRLMAEMSSHQEETNLILSLGGTPKQAIHRQLTASIKASTIPTIEQQKV